MVVGSHLGSNHPGPFCVEFAFSPVLSTYACFVPPKIKMCTLVPFKKKNHISSICLTLPPATKCLLKCGDENKYDDTGV